VYWLESKCQVRALPRACLSALACFRTEGHCQASCAADRFAPCQASLVGISFLTFPATGNLHLVARALAVKPPNPAAPSMQARNLTTGAYESRLT
jgi:hypothetical protein